MMTIVTEGELRAVGLTREHLALVVPEVAPQGTARRRYWLLDEGQLLRLRGYTAAPAPEQEPEA